MRGAVATGVTGAMRAAQSARSLERMVRSIPAAGLAELDWVGITRQSCRRFWTRERVFLRERREIYAEWDDKHIKQDIKFYRARMRAWAVARRRVGRNAPNDPKLSDGGGLARPLPNATNDGGATK